MSAMTTYLQILPCRGGADGAAPLYLEFPVIRGEKTRSLTGRSWRPKAEELAVENGPPPLIADAVEYPRPESLHTQGRWAMCAGSGDRKASVNHRRWGWPRAERCGWSAWM